MVGLNGGKSLEVEQDEPTSFPPTSFAAATASAADVKAVRVVPKTGPSAVSAEQKRQAAMNDGVDEANLDGVDASSATSSVPLCAPSCSAPAASASSQGRPSDNVDGATTTAAVSASGASAEKAERGDLCDPAIALSASPQPTLAAIPVADAISIPSVALAGPAAPQPRQQKEQQQQQRRHGQGVQSLPAAACTEEALVAVARELQEYAEAMARARSSREAKGGGKGGGVAGGALGAGALGTVSPSLYLQEPPAERLFDTLLDEVLQALGDA